MLGVARLTKETGNAEEGEFAILVRDDSRAGAWAPSSWTPSSWRRATSTCVRSTANVLAANRGCCASRIARFDVRPSEDPEIRKIVLHV